MKFRPYADDKWFLIGTSRNPDEDERDWRNNHSEFSEYKEVSFKKHLKDLNTWMKFCSGLNGSKIKEVLKHENFWYSRTGLTEVINGE